MRFLLCLAIWIMFVGGLYAYTEQRDRTVPERVAAPVAEQSQERISIELTPTFSVEDDPFALRTEQQAGPFELRLNGRAVETGDLAISRGQTLLISDLDLTLGDHNEVYIKASPPLSESNMTHGIRLRLLDHERILADQTVWSSGGGLVSGTVPFSLNDTPDTDHDH